jgi:3-oxoacyl-[acyl-carrier-protein] synthase II
MKRRVVITGMGVVSPLANGAEATWKKLIAGQSGIRPITSFDVSDLPAKIAGTVPEGDQPGLFHADSYMSPKDQRKVDRFILYAVSAAIQAVEDSGWMPEDEESRERTGVMIGSGIGGLPEIESTAYVIKESGTRRVSPFFGFRTCFYKIWI